MGFRNGAYAAYWGQKENKYGYFKGSVSISRKKDDGSYVKSFQGDVDFVGEAKELAEKMERALQKKRAGMTPEQARKVCVRFHILECDTTCNVSKDNKVFYNFTVFKFEPSEDKNATKAPAKKAPAPPPVAEPEEEEDLPF